jgi:hypothetical protein
VRLDSKFTTKNLSNYMANKNRTVEIPVEGSLGILAHGDIGLLSWRKKRDLELKKKKTNKGKKNAKK